MMLDSSLLLSLGLVLCLPTAFGQFDWSAVTSSTSLQAGEGTFYGEGQDAQGTCSYSANFANTNDLPWSTGTDLTVALNDAQFADGAACGLCVRLRGTGSGLGTTPIPASWTNAIVNNRCPECSKGDIDLAAAGDGRWNIQWYAVPCEVGNTPLTYSIVVSSYYWFSMVVSNTRVPITAVSVKIGGTWLDLKRSNNNQWPYYNTNGPWQTSFPMGVRITSVTGQTIEDTITSKTGNTGTVQFSSDGAGSTAVPSVPRTSGPVGSGPPVPTTSSSPPVQSLSAAIPSSPVSPPIGSVPPPVASVPPPVSRSPPAPLSTDGGFYIEDNQQCGGAGGACNNKAYTSAPCADAPWKAATCRSSNYACLRGTSDLWTCVPGVAGTPPVGSVPPPTQSTPSSPPTTSTSPPVSSQSPPPAPTTTASAQPPTQYGIQLSASVPPPTPPSPVSTPSEALSPPSPQQTSSSPPTPPSPTQSSQAAQSPPATPAASSQSSSSSSSRSYAISAGGQCGGTSSCDPAGTPTDKVTCNNGPWSGASCPSGYSCTANPGPLVWTCMTSNIATAGRRLLQPCDIVGIHPERMRLLGHIKKQEDTAFDKCGL